VLRRVSAGTLDGRLREAVAIRAVCHQVAVDLGEPWERLPAAKRLLAEQVAVKAVVLSLMTAWALARTVIGKDGALRSPLGSNYLAWSNSLRADLALLGLERRPRQVLDLVAALAAPPGNGEILPPADGTAPRASRSAEGPSREVAP
jgi:hypothetical protein